MRLLVYETKSAAFSIGLEIPSSTQLSQLKLAGNELCVLLFAADDEREELHRVSVSKLLQLGNKYLETNLDQKKLRAPKSVQVERYGEVIRGPAKGLTGFSIGGLPCSAMVEEDGVTITRYCQKTDSRTESKIYCNVFPVDSAELRTNYSRGSNAYAFVSQLVKGLSKTRRKFVWLCIEY